MPGSRHWRSNTGASGSRRTRTTAGSAGFAGSGRSSKAAMGPARQLTAIATRPPHRCVHRQRRGVAGRRRGRVGGSRRRDSNSLETLPIDVFQPRVGETFRIHPRGDSEIEANLNRSPRTRRRPEPRSVGNVTATDGVLAVVSHEAHCPAAAEHLRGRARRDGRVRDLPGPGRARRQGG
jgi:hypothetical protein